MSDKLYYEDIYNKGIIMKNLIFILIVLTIMGSLLTVPDYDAFRKKWEDIAGDKIKVVPLQTLASMGYRIEMDPTIKISNEPKVITYDQFEKAYGNTPIESYQKQIIVDTLGNLTYLYIPVQHEKKHSKYDTSIIAPPNKEDWLTFLPKLISAIEQEIGGRITPPGGGVGQFGWGQ